jgi:hypothetical protein
LRRDRFWILEVLVFSAKRWAFYGTLLLIMVFTFEVTSAYFLYRYYAHKRSSFFPEGAAIGFVIKKALHLDPAASFSADRLPVFRPDTALGYTTNPGTYRIIETSTRGKHAFRLTVPAVGVRATSYRSTTASRRLYIIGDSSVWGFGLDDEMTAPWLLQTRLLDYQVINMALTGYSNVQGLLQYRAISSELRPDDIVLFFIGQTSYLRNVAHPSWISKLSHGFEMSLSDKNDFQAVQIPFGALTNQGELNIGYTPIVCMSRERGCTRAPLGDEEMHVITTKVFDEIVHNQKCHILVAVLSGNMNDPTVAFLRSSGVPTVNLRIAKGEPDAEDYFPEDSHPGAFTDYRYYEVLLDALLKNRMLGADASGNGR